MKPKVHIYTDGACSGNPGPGGWGAILVCENPSARKEFSGSSADTTNNRMELMGVIAGLETLKHPCEVLVTTDSAYIYNAFTKKWLDSWVRRGWLTAGKKPVKNQDLWERLLAACERHTMKWEWVKGHNEHPENEAADRLAVAACKKLLKKQ